MRDRALDVAHLAVTLMTAVANGDIVEAVWLNEEIADRSGTLRELLLDEAERDGLGWGELAARFGEDALALYTMLGVPGHGPPPP